MASSHLPLWAQELCQDIESNDPTITKVTTVGMENDVALALANALTKNSTVTDVDLDLSFVHEDGIAAMEEMLANNTFLESVRIETCLNDCIHFPYPESRDEQRYSRAGIARGLVHNTSVKKLILDGAGLDDDFWTTLINAPEGTLEVLHISRAELPPSFVDYLTTANASSSIKRLYISDSILYTGDDNTNFVDNGILCYALQAASKKRIVRLSSVRVQHGVKQYEHTSTSVPRFINIARFRNDVLYIERGFTADCAVALAAKLQTNTALKRLYLAENPIGGRGVAALGKMLESNTTLQMLDIRSVFIDDQDEAATALGKALEHNTSLTELRLSSNRDINFSHPLAAALRVNGTLRILTLNSTNVTDEGSIALANALETNRSLRVLILDRCHIQLAGGMALATMLRSNTSLQKLSLTGNVLCESSTQALLHALRNNYRLKSLTLDAPSENLQNDLDYLNRLTPCGRAMLTQNVTPSLISRVLNRVSKDGGTSSLFTMLSERPDLVLR